MRRKNKQAQCYKHSNLRKPSQTIVKSHDHLFIWKLCLPQHQTNKIYRKDSVAFQKNCNYVRQQHERNHYYRIKSFVSQFQTVNEEYNKFRHEITYERSHTHIQHKSGNQGGNTHIFHRQDTDKSDSQKNSHRVITARLKLKQRLQRLLQAYSFSPYNAEYSGGIR